MKKHINYDHVAIEKKWQKEWSKKKIYKTLDPKKAGDKPKYYVLDMFPYPSGEGLHVGHPKGYIATDIVSRMKRMQGHNVLHPMGFDAFGLPAEQYAIKMKTNPAVAVGKNVARYKKQLEILGLDYDWSREVNTTDPKFYKWTQWIFLKLLEKGLAYESYEPINWCPTCKTGLANEDLEDGKCERCGTLVERKPMRQWVLKITDYADRMLEDLNLLTDWPESIKESQRNWIGRSEGAEFKFEIQGLGWVNVFTTRPDTLYGVTYIVLAPEYPMLSTLEIENKEEVNKYIESVKNKTEIERTDAKKEKTGVQLKGLTAVNPANGEKVPVWVADYVLNDYGTGAVMAVPAHDERDAEFSKVYNLPVKQIELENKEKMIEKFGKKVVKYKLRDWVFSRQRYWGEPIPVYHTPDGRVVPVSEKELPVLLPMVKSYEPTGTGESPLAAIEKWVNVPMKVNGKKEIWKRETNTMPQWAGSSWYYLRYMDPKNTKNLVDPKIEEYWNQADLYVGGAEHATRHLIYARFWHKFLYDLGVVSTKEPFMKLRSVGLIMAEDGRKMSKRWGNVVNPDDVIATYGADTMRVYEMFMGPFDQAIAWNTQSMIGSRRFIERIWNLRNKTQTKSEAKIGSIALSNDLEILLNQTIKKITEDIESMLFNTAVSSLMILLNRVEKEEKISIELFGVLIRLLAPFAPHVSDELWSIIGNRGSVHNAEWPKFDQSKLESDTINVAIQVNGKVRGSVVCGRSDSKESILQAAKNEPNVTKWLEGKKIMKEIYVPGKLVSIVVD
jgi:leucyl-tRNA synthetase